MIPKENRPHDLNPDVFAPAGTGNMSQTLITAFDAYTPAQQIEVFSRHKKRIGFCTMLGAMGFKKGASTPTVGHYEYPWNDESIQFGSIVTASTGPGTNVVVALSADSMHNASQTINGAAIQTSFPVENEILEFHDGAKAQIIAKDTSVTPHRLTLRPLDAAVDLGGTTIEVNKRYAIIGNAYGEGTGLPKGRVPRFIEYTNTFQISKDAFGISGTELTNKMYFNPMPSKPGSYFLKMEADTYDRFTALKDNVLLFGGEINNIVTLSEGLGHDVAVSGTEGFIDFARVSGNETTYVVGGLVLSDFDRIARIYDDERIGFNDVCAWQGFDHFQELENVLIDLYSPDLSYSISKDMLGLGDLGLNDEYQPRDEARDVTASFGFNAIRKSGMNFGFKKLHEFSYAKGVGAEGYDYRNWCIYTPLGYMTGKESVGMMPSIGYEYKYQNGYSRENVIGRMDGFGVAGAGGFGTTPINEIDMSRTGLLTEQAFHGTCANQIVLQTPN